MEIHKDIEIIDLALYLKKQKILVLSDMHIGFEESLARQGVLVPRFQYKDMVDRLEQVFAKVEPDTVILNGDLKHKFGSASKQEMKDTLRLFDYLSRKCKKIIIVKGNHDPGISGLAKMKSVEVIDEYAVDDISIVHGNELPKSSANVIIAGHEHPAVSLREQARVERFKCFLKGKFNDAILIVQPSFNPCIEGTDVTKEKTLSPLIKDISNFEVFVVDDVRKKTLYFGKVSDVS